MKAKTIKQDLHDLVFASGLLDMILKAWIKITTTKRNQGLGYSSVVACLPSYALGLLSINTTKKCKGGQGRRTEGKKREIEGKEIKFHQNLNFHASKGVMKKVKRQPTEWENIVANHLCDKGWICRIYKKLLT